MTDVAILGAGNGGLAAAVDLTIRGHRVRLFNRSRGAVDAVEARGGIEASGVLGERLVVVDDATTDLEAAVRGAEAVVVILPALAHAAIGTRLASVLPNGVPLVLNPGHMCGSLQMRKIFESNGASPPTIAELGTLSYVCRSNEPASVEIYLVARDVPLALVPSSSSFESLVLELFPTVRRVESSIETWLYDVNMILHPPGMILGAAWIESSAGGFRFYAEGVTRSVETTMEALDEERRSVGRAFGVDLPNLITTMAGLGTADADAASRGATGPAIRTGAANSAIRAPASLDHRYLHEDIPFGLVPLIALGEVAGVETPVASALVTLAEVISRRDYRGEGLNARRLGFEGATASEVKAMAEGAA